MMEVDLERQQKGKSKKLKVPAPVIIKDYDSHMNWTDIHNQSKTTYWLKINVPV